MAKTMIYNIFFIHIYRLSQEKILFVPKDYQVAMEYTKEDQIEIDITSLIRNLKQSQLEEKYVLHQVRKMNLILNKIVETNLSSLGHMDMYIPQKQLLEVIKNNIP